MRSILYNISIIILLSSCNHQSKKISDAAKTSLPILNVAAYVGKNVPDTFTWNSIQKKVAFIPLETSDRSLLGSPAHIAYIDKEKIVIKDLRTLNILNFNNKGQCLNVFNYEGNGPGEYLYLTNVSYNPSDSLLTVFDGSSQRLNFYTIKGEIVKSVSTKKLISGNISYFKGNRIVTTNISGRSRISIFDKDLNLIREVFPYDSKYNDKSKSTLPFFNNITYASTSDKLLYNNSIEGDTVYEFSETTDKPIFVVDKGDLVIPSSDRSDLFKAFLNLNPTYLKNFQFDVFSHYALIQYLFKGRIVAELWDIKKEAIISRNLLKNVVT